MLEPPNGLAFAEPTALPNGDVDPCVAPKGDAPNAEVPNVLVLAGALAPNGLALALAGAPNALPVALLTLKGEPADTAADAPNGELDASTAFPNPDPAPLNALTPSATPNGDPLAPIAAPNGEDPALGSGADVGAPLEPPPPPPPLAPNGDAPSMDADAPNPPNAPLAAAPPNGDSGAANGDGSAPKGADALATFEPFPPPNGLAFAPVVFPNGFSEPFVDVGVPNGFGAPPPPNILRRASLCEELGRCEVPSQRDLTNKKNVRRRRVTCVDETVGDTADNDRVGQSSSNATIDAGFFDDGARGEASKR